ncbi:23S rRNA (uracil(747)-C(5))-methyltransferase RlmC [Cellulomonas sp. DKR-3]|uniref:23S rRNA (Uracil(747)-C(5))-methyltransferase RlmC n=1 Tax=Cellulomonas fulva TaxID=2835530 RepID=A0ABS5U2E3_9CELL|nr:23S rRNA (uracil(747)-C(5))-methyltransferase RlmC [Cellulomonas fulva]MBT0995581.1 23S rRNA (uracil(747)-C(5))-methyltransferase RlmC [Cellulomonas fulva]
MQCSYFDAGLCRSCGWMGRPYDEQLAAKQQHCRALLADHEPVWLPPVASPEDAFRNKAKMVVAGTADAPTLGILDAAGQGVDLQGCGLYPDGLRAAFPAVARFVTRAAITPYDVPSRRGELKHVLVTQAPDGALMVRFVLRSQEAVARIRKHLPSLRAELPRLEVASVNVLPEHKAVLEGELEIPLTERQSLTMEVDGVALHLRPRSFFQTNTAVTAALYAQAAGWVADTGAQTVWDLYCGVGGFALHVGAPHVVGVETSAEAVASARLTAAELGHPDARFVAADATAWALATDPAHPPDAVVVNPPRRGIGTELARWLQESTVPRVVYSSCNAVSLAADLAAMPALVVREARVFDMFPQTTHYEVAVLLERAAPGGAASSTA